MDTLDPAALPSGRRVCPFCKGKKTAIAVDAIEPGGTLVNPRSASCMVCGGEGTVEMEPEEAPVTLSSATHPARVALWDAINGYASACGGDLSAPAGARSAR